MLIINEVGALLILIILYV